MVKLFIAFLWIWSLGVLFFGLIGLIDVAFAPSRILRTAARRLALVLVWPFVMLNGRGRSQLFAVLRETQKGDSK